MLRSFCSASVRAVSSLSRIGCILESPALQEYRFHTPGRMSARGRVRQVEMPDRTSEVMARAALRLDSLLLIGRCCRGLRSAQRRRTCILKAGHRCGRRMFPWNSGRLIGRKAPLKPNYIWTVRFRLVEPTGRKGSPARYGFDVADRRPTPDFGAGCIRPSV